jgi:predicted PurR-regulated permease PerM
MSKYWNLDRVMRFVLTSLGVIVALCLVYYLRGVLFPFIAAFLIAYIASTIVRQNLRGR